MGGTRVWALACAVMLAACSQGDGKILGDILLALPAEDDSGFGDRLLIVNAGCTLAF